MLLGTLLSAGVKEDKERSNFASCVTNACQQFLSLGSSDYTIDKLLNNLEVQTLVQGLGDTQPTLAAKLRLEPDLNKDFVLNMFCLQDKQDIMPDSYQRTDTVAMRVEYKQQQQQCAPRKDHNNYNNYNTCKVCKFHPQSSSHSTMQCSRTINLVSAIKRARTPMLPVLHRRALSKIDSLNRHAVPLLQQ